MLKHAHLLFKLFVSLGREPHTIHLVKHHAVIQAGRTRHADAPLRAHRNKEFKRCQMLGPDFDGIARHVLQRQAEGSQLFRIWPLGIERGPERP